MFNDNMSKFPEGMPPGKPIFLANPHLQYLYEEYDKCHNDIKPFRTIEPGDTIIIKACFLQFAPYAVWDLVEGTVIETYKENVKANVELINYTGPLIIQKWMITEHISRSQNSTKVVKPIPQRKRGRPRKNNGNNNLSGDK